MSLIPAGISGEQAYTLENSLRFRASADANLARTFSTPTDGKTWTYSVWVKRAKAPATLGHGSAHLLCTTGAGAQGFFGFGWNVADDVVFGFSGYNRRYSTGVLRDRSAWYHIVLKVDTTQATEADRAILYVNGVVFPWTTNTAITQNSTTQINQAVAHAIGDQTGQPYESYDGYLTEINFIDGQALDASYFGLTDAVTGVWAPKKYTGTYGTNGFYLPTTATTQAEGFNTVLFNATTAATKEVSDVGFQPDLVWFKSRSNAQNHFLVDSVRGGHKFLYSNANNGDNATGTVNRQWIEEFNSDGFISNSQMLSNNYDYAAWCWDAGSNQTSTGMSSVLYTGNGVAMKIRGFGFSPDLVWIKNRDGSAQNHMVFDSVRGPELRIQPDNSAAEFDQSGSLISFDSDGFSFGTSTTNLNAAGTNYVAWGWDAGSGDPVTNTDGDITSTVKASDATGFSIVTWTANGTADDRVGHGLNSAPEVIIYKDRSGTGQWYVWTTVIDGSNDTLKLDVDNAKTDNTGPYTSPNSTTISNYNYASSTTMVAYCFKSVSGVSDIGTYTGTGSTGNAITGLGFRPGFLMIKRTDAASEWVMVDATRDPFNPANHVMSADLYYDEATFGTTNRNIDFDSDGFTIQSTAAGGTTALNASGGTYMYMAFKGSYSDYVSPLNTDGDIDSRVKANTEKGFSIVSYEGTGTAGDTVGHGLSSAPEMVMVKRRDSTGDWLVWNETIASSDSANVLFLNDTAAATSNISNFNSTAPTSSVFTVGNNPATNSGGTHIAYCFASVAGYSDIGTYTGTGSSGNSVTTGFRPAFLMIKCSSAASTNWLIFDNTRDTDGVLELELNANNNNQEYDNNRNITLTDTGFEVDGSNNNINGSSQTYIYIAFADTRDAQFNFDASGNKNNWTPNNINSNASGFETYDIMTDVPTLTDEDAANYATINPLAKTATASTYADGNLKVTTGAAGGDGYGTISIPSSGKYYWEVIPQSGTGGPMIGLADYLATRSYSWQSTNSVFYYANGQKYVDGSGSAYGSSYSNGDVIGVAVDADAGDIEFFVNNVSQGSITHQVSELFPVLSDGSSANNVEFTINFGQQPFKYTPPTGFLPLNTYNLPDSTIKDGSEQFNTVLYNGNGSTQSITGVGFQPDLVWGKSRNIAENHALYDVVRGTTKALYTNLTNAEGTDPGVSSFDSDGFSLGGSTINASGYTYAAWNWKANGSGSSNSDGSITSTVSVNTTSGFSIATYTGNATAGATIGHGLGVTPAMFIIKSRSNAYNWLVYHKDKSSNGSSILNLNSSSTGDSGVGYLNNTGPTSSVFTVGSGPYTNGNTLTYVAYCFAGVEGFSEFGKYTGNGSSNGPFIYTGFRPAWVMCKSIDTSAQHWWVFDSVREGYNVDNDPLYANLNSAEGTSDILDLTSNGFKHRNSSAVCNGSGQQYIYAAFAENPFKNALAR